jgi:hypothetical protein
MPAAYWYSMPSAGTFTWLIFAFLCHLVIHRWWYDHYSLLFSAAMNTGVAISVTIPFFIFYGRDILFSEWWGNSDDAKCPLAGRI